ncbi:uncharacterized protein At3g06530-like [Salvia miltiorrhiza]|uniref:uncharacterized protein At3g06530-like n=1 Tax=Salvia miltiorrhiza TaxID=226208 RepID=UPI0025AC3809|nr:uncharacterized protein At3g06530-like [Salvia miltiorrhiza]
MEECFRNYKNDLFSFQSKELDRELATPVKKIQTSQHVTGFCTAVIFEVLGLVTVDSDIVKRILPYVSSGLQHGAKGLNQKASALMIVSLLPKRQLWHLMLLKACCIQWQTWLEQMQRKDVTCDGCACQL